MNIEFCEENSGTSMKMRYFRKNKVGAPGPPALQSGSATAVAVIVDTLGTSFSVRNSESL